MQRLGGGSYTRKNKKGGFVGGLGPTNPSCGCDMQAGWPKFLTENIPMPSDQRGGSMATTSQRGGSTCGAPPIPRFYQGGFVGPKQPTRGGSCAACSGLPMSGGGQPAAYNSNPVPDACPFPGTGYCEFYARGGANYGEPMNLQARLRGGYKPTKKNRAALKKWRKGQSIGFTMTSSLKAKGLIPRTSRKNKGKKLVSAKYK